MKNAVVVRLFALASLVTTLYVMAAPYKSR
jgi:hypothetical protein